MSDTDRSARRWWVRMVLTPFITGAVLFGAAGGFDWYAAWIFILLIVCMQVRIIVPLRRISPDLLVERSRVRAGTKPWDRVIMPLVGLILPALTSVVAGLDFRDAWTPPFPPAAQSFGFVLMAVSSELIARAMLANRFFAVSVRIQSERGHRVVSSGPYAVVRHPGYVGMMGATLGTPLALGSPLSAIPAVLCALLIVLRTALEDRVLRAELDGYAEYALRVRWRLIPGLW